MTDGEGDLEKIKPLNLKKAVELNTKAQSHKNREDRIYFYQKKPFTQLVGVPFNLIF